MTRPLPSTATIGAYFDSRLAIVWSGPQGMTRCPFHADHQPSLSLNAEKGVFFCHGCGAQGGLVEFERLFSRCDLKTARRVIGKLCYGR